MKTPYETHRARLELQYLLWEPEKLSEQQLLNLSGMLCALDWVSGHGGEAVQSIADGNGFVPGHTEPDIIAYFKSQLDQGIPP